MADPIMPVAPLRLSTITVWPSASLSFPATNRAIMSIVGPGGTGTTMVIGLAAGQGCASAGAHPAEQHNPHRTSVAMAPALMVCRIVLFENPPFIGVFYSFPFVDEAV